MAIVEVKLKRKLTETYTVTGNKIGPVLIHPELGGWTVRWDAGDGVGGDRVSVKGVPFFRLEKPVAMKIAKEIVRLMAEEDYEPTVAAWQVARDWTVFTGDKWEEYSAWVTEEYKATAMRGEDWVGKMEAKAT